MTVDFIPFANDASSANVVTQADYLAAASGSGYVQNGFPSGTAQSNKANKALRQSSVMAAAFAQFLAAKLSQNVLDSGGSASVTAIQNQIAAAAASAALTSGTIGSGVALAVFPAGTKMLFMQTSAPTGWTKDTTHNDKMLRIVSGTAGSGGSAALSSAWTSVALSGTVGGHTLTTSEIPAHTHSGVTGGQSNNHTHSYESSSIGTSGGSGGTDRYNSISSNTGYASNDHTHNFTSDGGTGGGASHNHGLTMNALTVTPAYVDAIICIKN
jgi:hypothetical protein